MEFRDFIWKEFQGFIQTEFQDFRVFSEAQGVNLEFFAGEKMGISWCFHDFGNSASQKRENEDKSPGSCWETWRSSQDFRFSRNSFIPAPLTLGKSQFCQFWGFLGLFREFPLSGTLEGAGNVSENVGMLEGMWECRREFGNVRNVGMLEGMGKFWECGDVRGNEGMLEGMSGMSMGMQECRGCRWECRNVGDVAGNAGMSGMLPGIRE